MKFITSKNAIMKKTYIIPSARTVELRVESMLAASMPIVNNSSDTVSDAAEAWTGKKDAWDSSNWSTNEGE